MDSCRQAEISEYEFPVQQVLFLAAITVAVAGALGILASRNSTRIERFAGGCFARLGRLLGSHPIKFIAGSLLFAVACSSGYLLQSEEVAPEALWVPTGAESLEHGRYVSHVWPANAVTDYYLTLPPGETVGANVLTPAVLQAMHRDWEALMSIRIDGDAIVDLNRANGNGDFSKEYEGWWSFQGPDAHWKCFLASPTECFVLSILKLWNFNASLIASLTPEDIQETIRKWEAVPLHSRSAELMVYKNFEINQVLGGISRDTSGAVVSAQAILTVMTFKYHRTESQAHRSDAKTVRDAVLYRWEADAACILGLEETHVYKDTSCRTSDALRYVGILQRSFEDEFGSLLRGDILLLIISYFLIIIYMILNLGKRDSVYSMVAVSGGAVLIVGLCFVMALGIGGFFGVKANALLNNIPFLLLGLGVDDAFVLAGEANRLGLDDPDLLPAQLVGLVAKSGGISVLVTSFTDALAFLIGSTTALPALSAFCLYAGIGIACCFVLMMTMLTPILALNWRRARDNRRDCFCCCKARRPHELSAPTGCCPSIPGCLAVQPADQWLYRFLRRLCQEVVNRTIGRIAVLLIFLCLLCASVAGLTQMVPEAGLERFFPDDSYVKEFFDQNRRFFGKGLDFDIFTSNLDIFGNMEEMTSLSKYIECQSFIQQETVDNWWQSFTEHMAAGGSPLATQRGEFFAQLYNWARGPGVDYWDDLMWVDADCGQEACTQEQYSQGIAHSRLTASFGLFADSRVRFNTLQTFRDDIRNIFGGDKMLVFPFTYDFLYWEEIGSITEELVKNLTLAAGVVFFVICILIPRPRIGLIVVGNIVSVVMEVIGLSYFLGLTLNGITTIYYLICFGLAVDYSAHIGHAFSASKGTSSQRACKAVERIGPSVVHAITSTLLAVVAAGFTRSYVAQVFFKVLLLVTLLSGFHGVCLLPILLALLGTEVAPPTDGIEQKAQGESGAVDGVVESGATEAEQKDALEEQNGSAAVPEDDTWQVVRL